MLALTKNGSCGCTCPCIFLITGTTNNFAVTNEDTGLPGKPQNNVLFILPRAKGLPGLTATFQKSIVPNSAMISFT